MNWPRRRMTAIRGTTSATADCSLTYSKTSPVSYRSASSGTSMTAHAGSPIPGPSRRWSYARLWPMRSCGMRWISTMSISVKATSISAGNGRAAICASRSSPMPRAYIPSLCRNSTATVSYSTAPTAPSISARWSSGATVQRTGSRRSRLRNMTRTPTAIATAALSARS